MAVKDLLVHVDDSKASTVRVDTAIRLAQTYDAHLTGLYVMPHLGIPVYAEVQIPDEILAVQREGALARVAEAEKAFRVACDGRLWTLAVPRICARRRDPSPPRAYDRTSADGALIVSG